MSTNIQKKKQEETTFDTQLQQEKARFEADVNAARDRVLSQRGASGSVGGGYVAPDSVRLAQNQLASKLNPQANPYQQGLNDALNKIMNREKFSYDLNGDALYQQYKDQYITQGQQAMMDTMGQAAALTGGYGNSYAQTVGQQTYQGHLQGLNDKVPELYQLALDQYNREGDELYNQYALFADRENTEYERAYRESRDAVDDQWRQKDFDWKQETYNKDDAYRYDVLAQEQSQFDTTLENDNYWKQTYFNEEQRQYDNNTRIQQEQWQAEFNETIRQYDNDYVLKVRQIDEDIRHNTISEAQGQQQIDLAKQELEQRKAEAAQDYEYKMASLKVKNGGSSSGGGIISKAINTAKKAIKDTGKSDATNAEDFLDTLVRTLEKSSASGQANARSTILSEINKAQKAGAITAEEAAALKKKYAPTGSSGGRYAY